MEFFVGLAIGLIALLLFWLRHVQQSDPLRNQIQEALIRQELREDRINELDQQLNEQKEKYEQMRVQWQQLTAEKAALENQIRNETERQAHIQSAFENVKAEHLAVQKELSELQQRIAELRSHNKYLLDKLDSQRSEFEELRKQAQLEFQNLATKILEEKAQRFTQSNKENIDNLLKPLGENLDQFKKKVEETYDKESKQRFSLEEKVKELVEMNQRLSQEANNLASALKGQSKKQGNWGEVILESILEKSGLARNREYRIQVSVQNEDGKRLQPDVIVYLPESKTIVIDSKVSLVSYDRFCAAETQEEQELALKEHIASIYRHVDELGDKKYDTVAGTMNFTMMFIPIEPAYLLAIQQDQDLWAYAYSKRVLLISPTNLITALKLVADLWKREQQSKNALEIAKQGEKLYDKIVGFLESMDDVGKHINKSQDSYQRALNQLRDGRGSVVKQAQKLKKLGLVSEKEIPDSVMPFDEEGEEDFPEVLPFDEK